MDLFLKNPRLCPSTDHQHDIPLPFLSGRAPRPLYGEKIPMSQFHKYQHQHFITDLNQGYQPAHYAANLYHLPTCQNEKIDVLQNEPMTLFERQSTD